MSSTHQPGNAATSGGARAIIFGPGGLFRRRVMPQLLWLLLALVLGFAVIWPVIQLQLRAFAEGGAAFERMFALARIGQTIGTTVILAIFSSLFALILGTLLAWCTSLLPSRVKTIGEVAPLLPLVIPV